MQKVRKTSSVNKKPINSDKGAKKQLISKELFADNVSININKMYPMLVMATMSSGKSTLINALLGEEILPSKNEACTSKIYSIIDDDNASQSTIYVTYDDGKTVIEDTDISSALDIANSDDSVSNVLICGHVKGVLNTDKALLIIDTPGPNNSVNKDHEKTMRSVLDNVHGGLIVYVINATQLGINDDKAVLDLLKKQIKVAPDSKVIFVLNKVDQIDEEKESIQQYVEQTRDYLLENKIDNPIIIPVSALAALLFKKVLNNDELTRNEYRAFCNYYELFSPKSYSMKAYAITDYIENPFEDIIVRDSRYKVSDLLLAIENTGIRLLEEEIQRAQILSSGLLNNKINLKRGKH